MVVRAFDGTKREVLGNIKLPIQVGPCTFDSEFIVNCLLGRPWIHMAGAMPSTLHQKVKFIVEESLITVVAKKRHDSDYDHYRPLPQSQNGCH